MGTRFLPLTKVAPKEMLPVGEVPALQMVIEEAVGAGIETIVIVNHPSKTPVEQYFAPAPDLLDELERAGKTELAERLHRLDRFDVRFVHQERPLGLGHAVGMARDVVGDQPFAVLLPDEIMGNSGLLAAMLDGAAQSNGSVIAVKEVPRDQVSSYGVVAPSGPLDGVMLPVGNLVEKPPVDQAPSNYIIIGRYVCTAEVMTEIGRLTPGAGGELQLTDALKAVCGYQPFHALVGDLLPGGLARYDTGSPAGWLEAVIEVSLANPRLGPALRDLISRIAAREGL